MKTRPYIKNLRHSSLEKNVVYMHKRFQKSIYYSKGDIDVQKIKVKNVFFVFSASSHGFPFIYFYNTYINIYVYLLCT